MRYNGAAINKNMMSCLLLFDSAENKINAGSIAALRRIERAHGKDALTASYTKLLRVGFVCSAHAERLHEMPATLIQYFLECVEWELKFEVVAAQDLKVEALDKERTGALGLIHAVAGRFAVHRTICGWAEDLAKTSDEAAKNATTILELLRTFGDYRSYEAEFNATIGEQNQLVVIEEGTAAPLELNDDDSVQSLAVLKKRFGSMTHSRIMDFCYDLLAGVHDGPIKACMKATSSDKDTSIRIDGCKWMDVPELPMLREIYRLLNQHRQVVNSTSTASMPTAGARTIKRYHSECVDELHAVELRKERAEAWRLAQLARKKLVHVGWGQLAKIQDVQQAYEKTPAFLRFTGKPGEQHRVFIFCADTFQEEARMPWAAEAEMTGAADVLLS